MGATKTPHTTSTLLMINNKKFGSHVLASLLLSEDEDQGKSWNGSRKIPSLTVVVEATPSPWVQGLLSLLILFLLLCLQDITVLDLIEM